MHHWVRVSLFCRARPSAAAAAAVENRRTSRLYNSLAARTQATLSPTEEQQRAARLSPGTINRVDTIMLFVVR